MALTLRTKIGYGVGHVLNDLCSAMWFTYLLIFFHHILRFNNTLSGIILLIGQVNFLFFNYNFISLWVQIVIRVKIQKSSKIQKFCDISCYIGP